MTYPFHAGPIVPAEPTRIGWHWHRLTDLARLATGHTPSRRQPEYWDGDIPWLQLPDIRALDGEKALDTSEHVSAQGIENSAAVLLPPGTVCLSRTASVGFVTVLGRQMATSQDFVNWICGPDLEPDFLMQLFIACRKPIRDLGSGAVHHTIYFPAVESFSVCIPPVEDQRQIAAGLARSLDKAASISRASHERLASAESLPAAYLREVFDGPATSSGVRLEDCCDLLPSRSLATDGDTDVTAVTTACLSEQGFLPSGLKSARMWASDVASCLVRPGEVLVARSNTPELVGRAAIYKGEPAGVVASDLTIRVWPRAGICGEYLGAFLSYLYQSGYWRERAGGASGTMKKITREQLSAQEVPVPSHLTVDHQRRIAADVFNRIESARTLIAHSRDERSAIDALPAALRRAAFNGSS